MNRSWYVVAGALVVGVVAQRFFAKTPTITLPNLAAGWALAAPANCFTPVPVEFKRWRGTEGAGTVCRGDYTGTPRISVTLYYMPSEFASAFDAAQKWQSQPGKMSFFQGAYFGVVESAGADAPTLERFVLAVEASLPKGSEWHH